MKSSKTKHICFKESPEFAARIDRVVSYMDISKREFLRRAVDEAVIKARETYYSITGKDM